MKIGTIGCVIFISVFCTFQSYSQSIEGIISDRNNAYRLPYCNVTITGGSTDLHTVTDSMGYYSMALPEPGRYV
ncbi:MAG: hypothetical protein HKN68_01385, partial [Saprospiraceae bacterium]|nr:hypothetical protein [Saprospiraceae bacterium]